MEIIISLISTLVGGGIIGIFVEKRKRKAEVLELIEASYEKYVQTHEKEYENLRTRVQELEAENKALKEELDKFKARLNL
jgi:putative homeodomain leucine zipper protein HDZ3